MDNLKVDKFNEMIATRAFYFPSAEIILKILQVFLNMVH